jgi:hypothetical protein
MRIIFTLLLLLPLSVNSQPSLSRQLTGSTPGLTIPFKDSAGGVRIRVICAKPASNTANPLLVIDGIITPFSRLGSLNPNDIESISILKGNVAVKKYGQDGNAGVIVIITKPRRDIQISVKDSLDRKEIPRATVTFISGIDTMMFLADDEGRINAESLKRGEEYHLSISATGFKPYATKIKVSAIIPNEFLLQRNSGIGDTIVVVAWGRVIRRCYRGCCNTVMKCETFSTRALKETLIAPAFILYPNPVGRGQYLTIESVSVNEEMKELRILDLSGRLMGIYNEGAKGPERWRINTDSRWTPGMYLVQMVGINGRTKQEKLLVQ